MLEKIVFQLSERGFFTPGLDRRLAEIVSDQARDWINSVFNEIEVVDISLSVGKASAVAIVWYKRKQG